MSKRKPWIRVETKLSKAHVALIDQLAIITDQSRSSWIKQTLLKEAFMQWHSTPGRPLWLRPKTPVFVRDGDRWRQVAETLGGERCWLIETVGTMPAGLGGGLAVRCDIVPIGMVEGLTMTDAIVPRENVGGPL